MRRVALRLRPLVASITPCVLQKVHLFRGELQSHLRCDKGGTDLGLLLHQGFSRKVTHRHPPLLHESPESPEGLLFLLLFLLPPLTSPCHSLTRSPRGARLELQNSTLFLLPSWCSNGRVG